MNEGNGCFRISKHQYKNELLSHKNGSVADFNYAENNNSWQDVNMHPGDILCFSSFLVHNSKDNLSLLDRSCFFITYSPDELGDQREKYFSFKRKKFPPRIERDNNKNYEDWRKTLSRQII